MFFVLGVLFPNEGIKKKGNHFSFVQEFQNKELSDMNVFPIDLM